MKALACVLLAAFTVARAAEDGLRGAIGTEEAALGEQGLQVSEPLLTVDSAETVAAVPEESSRTSEIWVGGIYLPDLDSKETTVEESLQTTELAADESGLADAAPEDSSRTSEIWIGGIYLPDLGLKKPESIAQVLPSATRDSVPVPVELVDASQPPSVEAFLATRFAEGIFDGTPVELLSAPFVQGAQMMSDGIGAIVNLGVAPFTAMGNAVNNLFDPVKALNSFGGAFEPFMKPFMPKNVRGNAVAEGEGAAEKRALHAKMGGYRYLPPVSYPAYMPYYSSSYYPYVSGMYYGSPYYAPYRMRYYTTPFLY